METIKVKYLADIEPLAQHEDWVDLRAAENWHLSAGDYAEIRLGVAIQLPDGYEAIVAPRSSAFRKYGILQANGIGIIDESYCGDNDEWHMPVYATRKTVINKNDRICQFRIQKHQPNVYIEVVDALGNADRGGLGSTGRK